MAPKPPTACPKCGKAIPAGQLCPNCVEQAKKTEEQPKLRTCEAIHDARKAWKHLYHLARWYNDLQPAILRRDPVCVICRRKRSRVADHIKDHRGDPVLFFDPNNLRGVCFGCHNEKTGTEHGVGDRVPVKEGLNGNIVVDHGPKIPDAKPPDAEFDFLAAALNSRLKK